MNTPSNTNAPSAKKIYTLSDLISFDLPQIQRNFINHNIPSYTLDGTDKDLHNLKSAVSNAQELICGGIEAITYLLLTIELNQEKFECILASQTRIDALALIFELSKSIRTVNEMEWLLDQVTPKNNQA